MLIEWSKVVTPVSQFAQKLSFLDLGQAIRFPSDDSPVSETKSKYQNVFCMKHDFDLSDFVKSVQLLACFSHNELEFHQ